jgi:ABC-type nitrate/sulfonate/bicarbonate transport system substrate-binding protein
MVRRAMTGLLALVLAGIGFWASSASLSFAASPTKLSLGMPTTPPNLVHIGPWVAKEQGFFTEEGLER